MNAPAATFPTPPPSAESGTAPSSPPWADTYLRALSEHRQKALAALAAGQELPMIVRQRHTDPCFAQREAEILEALADLLESEAIRRTTARAPVKKVGSDALLLRLLKIFHPRWSLPEKKSLARLAPTPCAPNRPVRGRREFDFGTRRQRSAFQQWEREQAIALALSSFYEGFQNLPATSYSLSAQYRDLTGESLGQLPPRAPAPWLRSSKDARPATLPESAPVVEAGLERNEPERSGDGRRQNDSPATAGQTEGCEWLRTSTPLTPGPNPQPISKPAVSPAPTSPRKPGLGRRLLWGLAMPPDSKTGLKPYPGYIPWLIRVGAIKSPGTLKPTSTPFSDPATRQSDTS